MSSARYLSAPDQILLCFQVIYVDGPIPYAPKHTEISRCLVSRKLLQLQAKGQNAHDPETAWRPPKLTKGGRDYVAL